MQSTKSPFQPFTADPKNYTATTGCAAEVRQCKLPFTFNDKNYTTCTNDLLFPSDSDDRTEESFWWCATSTNSDGSMKKGKWGRCDEASCKWESPAPPTPDSHHLNCVSVVPLNSVDLVPS